MAADDVTNVNFDFDTRFKLLSIIMQHRLQSI